MKIPRPTAPASFTLVELLAATTVLSLLMVALVGMFDQAMRGWQNAQRGIDARREVRAALQFLESDLRGLMIGPGRPIFNELDDNQSSRLTFLTLLSTNAQEADQRGDVCAVQYRVVFTNNSYRLIRRLQMSTTTFAVLAGNTNITAASQYVGGDARDEELALNVVYFRSELKSLTNMALRIEGASTNRPDFVQMELTAYPRQIAQGFTQEADFTDTKNIQKYAKTYLWRTAP